MKQETRIMTLVGCSLALSLFGLDALASDKPAEPMAWGGYGFAFVGTDFGSVSGLADVSEGTLGNDAEARLSFGGGGRAYINGFLLGGKGFGVFGSEEEFTGGTMQLTLGGGGFDFGYAVVDSDQLMVSPHLGVGGYSASLFTTTTAGDETEANSGGMYIEASASTQFFIPNREGGFLIGLEAGYMHGLQGSAWEADDGTPISGAGEANYQALSIRLLLGGGGSEHVVR